MEKNANPHRDTDGGSVCATISAEAGDAPTGGGGVKKGAADQCKKSSSEAAAAISALVPVSSNSTTTSDHNVSTGVHKPELAAGLIDILPPLQQRRDTEEEAGSGSRTGDQISNGHDSAQSAGDNQGGPASKLVNNTLTTTTTTTDGPSSPPSKDTPAARRGESESTSKLLPKPTHLCPDRGVKVAGDHSLSEGLPTGSGSDPEPSLDGGGGGGGESRSLDSLEESFSNLNSCPSSDLNSEGLEDRGLALALHSEFGADGSKAACAKDRTAGQSIYHIKWIKWREESTPIITQNENGPCPLLAIMNVLLLAWKVKMPPMMEIITVEQLMEYLGDYILETKPKEISEAQRLNYEQNMSDAMAVLHKLQTGLDVNVKFTGVRVFEYTPECIVFDLLDIPLYHGWLVDPQMHDIVKAVGNCSYNQLVEKIISCKQSDNSELAGEGIVAEQFLSSTATQLTYHGLCELTSTVQEGELCVFFRNNHFSTMIKYKGQLYLLVTDQGFLTEEKVVWESLHNVDGDGNFCDSEFRLRPPSDPETVYRGQQDQIDQV